MAGRSTGSNPQQLPLWDAREGSILVPLPLAGADVRYAPDFFSPQEAEALFQTLRHTVPWQGSSQVMYDRVVEIPRLMAWHDFGDEEDTWAAPLYPLRDRINAAAGGEFDAVRLILYRTGRDSLAWHADREAFEGPRPIVASVSLGATRRFLFRPKAGHPGERLALELPAGSLLVMAEGTQENWEHTLPKTAKPVGERINLTFRMLPR